VTPGGPSARLLEGIELVIFDKDGTLIDFQAMWGGWVRALADHLEGETGTPLEGPLFDVLGVDPATGRVLSHGLLAATPMSRIRSVVVETVAAAGVPAGAAEAAVERSWRPPDPVELAHPIQGMERLLTELHRSGRRIAIATSDDREPTERTLAALGLAELVAGLACADDGEPVKPHPAAVFRLCSEAHVVPGRTVVVGDSVADLAMGRAAGVARVIGVLTGVADRAALAPHADVVLGSVAELLPA
jgi:phosphoglycolate phosphatase-like HAD superfamily hydrolase